MSSDPNSTKMDNREDLEHNVPCTFDNVMFGQTPNPPPPPLLPTGTPVLPWPAAETGWFVNNTFPGSCLPASQQQGPLTVAPTIMRPAYMYREPGTDNQGQLRQPETNVLTIPDNVLQNLRPVGVLNGVPMYDYATPAPPPNTSAPKKRKCRAQQDEDRPYVKKPPNAFMLYLKEQRPKVTAELNIPGSAAVNAVVGQRWKSLSNDQKARYFDQAETERRNHAKEHPAWSTKENYGKKRKRIRLRKESACVHEEEEAQQANHLRMRPTESQPSSSSHSFLTEPHELPQTKPDDSSLPRQQPVCVQLPNTQASPYTPLSQENQVSPASHMNFPEDTSLDSPVAPLQFQTQEAFVTDREEELLSMLEALDPLPITAQSQQPSPTPASPVDASQTASVQPQVDLFQDRDEPICFAEIQEDMWSVLDYLPVSQQANVLSSPDSHNYSTPKRNLICPADSPPSRLASSPVAFTELQSTPPIFCELMKNYDFTIDYWADSN
ncbi:transcription factor 7-like 1 isoform X2 [Oreochromis niloticus]|uniref:Transcription factor 7-like 1 n=1 Tax=Oreochromis niloticus TaxID=8128 RepID=A0A669BSG1_ORENI|nr:transcription factor 7-like 1 isoform X2 [Oreochromis niloticus]